MMNSLKKMSYEFSLSVSHANGSTLLVLSFAGRKLRRIFANASGQSWESPNNLQNCESFYPHKFLPT